MRRCWFRLHPHQCSGQNCKHSWILNHERWINFGTFPSPMKTLPL
jgi:hypothetical protein